MKTRLLLAVMACLLFFAACSQPVCGFDVLHLDKLRSDARYRTAVQETEKKVQQFIAKNERSLSARTTGVNSVLYTIPVAVHVVHTGGGEGTLYNPSEAQIQNAINYLNQVFNGSYPGTTGIGDIQLQFALATKDPNCNNTSGIIRVDGSSINGYAADGISTSPGVTPGVTEASVKNLSQWHSGHYYNIWIVNKIDGKDGTSGTFTAGYAYFPGAPSAYDGTVMLATQMTSGKSTLPHEIGHAFGLYHTFQGSANNSSCPVNNNCNTDGDQVCDTDPVTHNYDTLSKSYNFNCRTGNNTCGNTFYDPATESNYMGYTSCNTLFTAGQKARVLSFANSVYRKSLSTSLGLNPVYPVAFSTPVAASCWPVTSTNGLSGNYAGILNIEVNNRSLGSSTARNDNGFVNGTGNCLNLIQLTAGATYMFAVTVLGSNQEQLKAWIDYNNDGVYDDLTERIHSNSSITTGVTSGSFSIPPSATQNTMLRMRVMDDVSTAYGVPAISDGCFNPMYGQAEDYPIYISSGTLPVTLLHFSGIQQNNMALLTWKTGTVQELRYFDIEKSVDGNNFKKIGTVNVGSQSSAYEFSFTDPLLAENNYYRLRMVATDGKHKLSQVTVIRRSGAKQSMWVMNNPFQHYLDLSFAKQASQVRLQLISSTGALMAEKSLSVTNGQFRWYLPENISSGHYLVNAFIGSELFVQKVIRQ